MVFRIVIGVALLLSSCLGVTAGEADLEWAFANLGHRDAAERKRAEDAVIQAGEQGLRSLKDHFFPDIDQLVKDLEFGDFKVRRRARKRLLSFGKVAETKLRDRLERSDEPNFTVEANRLLKILRRGSAKNTMPTGLLYATTFVLDHPSDSPSVQPFLNAYFRSYGALPDGLRKRGRSVVESFSQKQPSLKDAVIEGIEHSTRKDLPTLEALLAVAAPATEFDYQDLRYRRGSVVADTIELSSILKEHTQNKDNTTWRFEMLEKTGKAFFDEIPAHVYYLLRRKEPKAHALAMIIIRKRRLRIEPFSADIARVIRNYETSEPSEDIQRFFTTLWYTTGWRSAFHQLADECFKSTNVYLFVTGVRLMENPSKEQIAHLKNILRTLASGNTELTSKWKAESNWMSGLFDMIMDALTGLKNSRSLFRDVAPALCASSDPDIAKAGLYLLGPDLTSHQAILERLVVRESVAQDALESAKRWVPDKYAHFEALYWTAVKDALVDLDFDDDHFNELIDYELRYKGTEMGEVWLKKWKQTVEPLTGTEDGEYAECIALSYAPNFNVPIDALLPKLRGHHDCCLFENRMLRHLLSVTGDARNRVHTFMVDAMIKPLNEGTTLSDDGVASGEHNIKMALVFLAPRILSEVFIKQLKIEGKRSNEYQSWTRPVKAIYTECVAAIYRCPDMQAALIPLMTSDSVDVRVMAAEALFRCGKDAAVFLPALKAIPVESLDHGSLDSAIFVLQGCGEPAETLLPYFSRYLARQSTETACTSWVLDQVVENHETIHERLFIPLGPKDKVLMPLLRTALKACGNDDDSAIWDLGNALLSIAPDDKETLDILTQHMRKTMKVSSAHKILCNHGHTPKLSTSELERRVDFCLRDENSYYDVTYLGEHYRDQILEAFKEWFADRSHAVWLSYSESELIRELGVSVAYDGKSIDQDLDNLLIAHKDGRINSAIMDVDEISNSQLKKLLKAYQSEDDIEVIERMNMYWPAELKSKTAFAKVVRKRLDEFPSEWDKFSFRAALVELTTDSNERTQHVKRLVDHMNTLDPIDDQWVFFDRMEILCEIRHDLVWDFFLKLWHNPKVELESNSISGYPWMILLDDEKPITPDFLAFCRKCLRRFDEHGEPASAQPEEILSELAVMPEVATVLLPQLKALKYEYRATWQFRSLMDAIRRHAQEKTKKADSAQPSNQKKSD